MKRKEIYLILHNIRSLHNVGSIFRTADAAGVKKIYLAGYTPAPFDRFGKIRPKIAKTALGAEKTVEWETYNNIGKLIAKLKEKDSLNLSDVRRPFKRRTSLVAIEQSSESINYKNFKPKYPLALIFGNEIRGISSAILKKCDKIVEIPMAGRKESLNVSVSAGIVLFSLI